MRNRVKSYKKKSPIVLFRDRFHLSALLSSDELSFVRGIFRNCGHCYPHSISPVAIIYIRKRLHLLRQLCCENRGTKYIFQYFKYAEKE